MLRISRYASQDLAEAFLAVLPDFISDFSDAWAFDCYGVTVDMQELRWVKQQCEHPGLLWATYYESRIAELLWLMLYKQHGNDWIAALAQYSVAMAAYHILSEAGHYVKNDGGYYAMYDSISFDAVWETICAEVAPDGVWERAWLYNAMEVLCNADSIEGAHDEIYSGEYIYYDDGRRWYDYYYDADNYVHEAATNYCLSESDIPTLMLHGLNYHRAEFMGRVIEAFRYACDI